MAKDNAVYIGSTPKHLTRIAKEIDMKKRSENNRRLLEALGYHSQSSSVGSSPFLSTQNVRKA
ncbi:hypothetical protein [Cytobacillus purgationiresistens]|uniref:Uncharacterized protein n=1 Tax=Cytobacillus purgationiresistens TaxID=863449 RepID=A0ABU0APE8_9BACI|nr:hypothetical protein [Cytobacillus purgationiresistens]MDQ0272616.1 hypothetical protein [Cytobacillus purgationiresistens]